MAIGVYRIYVSAGWTGALNLPTPVDGAGTHAVDRLVATLDKVPALLYRLDRLAAADLGPDASHEAICEAIRVAMTQSHIALMRIEPHIVPGHIEGIERRLARESFRRRIPAIGIIEGGRPEDCDPLAHEVDRVVRLEPDALACAIQELAEQAAAERRLANQALIGQPLKAVTFEASQDQPSNQVPETPYAAIIEAYEQRKRAQSNPAR